MKRFRVILLGALVLGVTLIVAFYVWLAGGGQRKLQADQAFLERRTGLKWPAGTQVTAREELDWVVRAHIRVPPDYARREADARMLQPPPKDNPFPACDEPFFPVVPAGREDDYRYYDDHAERPTKMLFNIQTGDVWISARQGAWEAQR